MPTYRLTLEYEGTRYRGWQEQQNARSVAGELRRAITETGVEIKDLGGAGRTDAGVHALAQAAHLRLGKAVETAAFRRAVNDRLPPDIHILSLEAAPADFHARHGASSRSYLYQISCRRTALAKRFVWWVKSPLDTGRMAAAAALLAGRHDFKLFCERPAEQTSTLVVVDGVELATAGSLVLVRLVASHFLWKMVRRVVGTLVEVGNGRLAPAAFTALLAGETPRQKGGVGGGWAARRMDGSPLGAVSRARALPRRPAARRDRPGDPRSRRAFLETGRVSYAAMELLYAAHVPAGDGPFPTILALHGWGANAHDLLGLAPMLHGGRALVLCPQGPLALPIGGGAYGYGWFPLNPGMPPDIDAFRRGADALRAFVDGAMARYPVDPKKIVPIGFSQGGVMAYDLALRDPGRFAGAGALSSWFPELLAADLPKSPALEGFPVLIVHGTQDTSLPVDKARESRELLRPFGVTLTYREFEMGHEIRPEALRVVLKWLDEKALAAR